MNNNNKRRIVDIFKNRKVFGTALGIVFYLFCIFFFTYAFYSWRSEETEVVIGINDSQAEVEFENNGLVNAENIGPVLNYLDGANGGFTATNELNRAIEINIRLRILSISDNLVNEDFKYILLKSEDGGVNYDVEVTSGNFTSLQVGMNLLTIDTIPAGAIYAYKLYVYIDGSVKNNNEMQSNSMMSVLSIRDYTELSEMAAGSYVAYTGNNGCKGKSCKGQNANYVSDTDMGYCSDSNSKFTVNGWRVAYTKAGTAYIVSAGAPECFGKFYYKSKSNDTTTLNYYDNLTYLVSDTFTHNSTTSNFVLGTTTTYSLPDDISSLNNKYTCGDATTTSCSTLYRIIVDSDTNNVELEKFTYSTCTSSTSSTASNYKSCQMNYKVSSTSTTTYTHYYGTSYIVVDGGFQLSGTTTSTTTYSTGKYTCKKSTADAVCTTLYYVTGNGHSVTSGSYTYYYASYRKYTISDYLSYSDGANNSYLYGNDYDFDVINGGYTLKNTSLLVWNNNYQSIISDKKYTCLSDSGSCDTMYEITEDSTSSQIIYYTHDTISSSSIDPSSVITSLNEETKKYCNTEYAYSEKCDENSVWAMNGDDFKKITTETLLFCSNYPASVCGSNNDLINNGGIYWYGTQYSSTIYLYYFNSTIKNDKKGNNLFGLRPVIRLDNEVIVTGGSGTYGDPYIIEKNDKMYLSEVEAGSYVAYTGNNGCVGEACNGQNANYVSDTNMGYCSSSSSKFTVNGWRVAYTEDNTAYIVSAGAPECVNGWYVEKKSDTTSNINYSSSFTYLVSDTATYDSATSSYVLGTTTTYTYPDDGDFYATKFTCKDSISTSCNEIYTINTNESFNTVDVRFGELTTTTCTNSTDSSSENYKKCQINSNVSNKYYYGKNFIMDGGLFKLSGDVTNSSSPPSGYPYTLKSTSNSSSSTGMYYITGDVHSALNGSVTAYYGSYIEYDFGNYISSKSNEYYYKYGSDYELDLKTGTYILKNTSTLSWKDNYQGIISTNKYTCFSDSDSCTTMYEITSDSTSSLAVYYTYTSKIGDSDTFINRIDEEAKKYCHEGYSYLGKCDSNSVWAMNGDDFSKITTSTLSSCNGATTTACGNDNDLIKNGGIYWYGAKYSDTYPYYFNSTVKRDKYSNNSFGLRPVIRLDPYTLVTGGSGTYEEPYKIGFIEPEEPEETEET